MKIAFVGDLHGHWDETLSWLQMHKDTADRFIQVGDVGVGFSEGSSAASFDDMFAEHQNLVVIRGNHDNPSEIKQSSHYIADGHYEQSSGMMFVGGANSIDKQYRTVGVDWWEDEELSYSELEAMIDRYREIKPRIMVTHECPDALLPMFPQKMLPIPSRTRDAFQVMWEYHQPEMWIFGHFHLDYDAVINGTRFVCVNQYSIRRFDI